MQTPTRRHSRPDQQFIKEEVRTLLKEGIIEKCQSPWRAQVLVTSDDRHKRRMVIDYSRTINRYTHQDAYPIPRMDDLVQNLARHNVFSKLDLKSAYHQVPLREDEKKFTAFEADGQLFQFRRLPFGLTNAVAVFQRAMNALIVDNDLQGTFAYIDDVIVCGMDQEEHDRNLQRFLEVAKDNNITLNDRKCEYGLTEITYLGYCISKGSLRPDPGRLQPLKDMPVPLDLPTLRRTLGLLSYYSQWIPNFSSRVLPLLASKSFPLGEEAVQSFNSLREDICRASVAAVDETLPFEVETDASASALAATLSQLGRPVAFFSRVLSPSEKHQPAVEREALAVVEAIRKWRSFLVGRRFKVITDQQAVSFMFDEQGHASKIKNAKILRWRLELSEYQYDIQYRPGVENLSADAISRVCATRTTQTLEELHRELCHPGVTRLCHFVKSKNLPHSVEEVRRVCSECRVCSELKPRFYKPPESRLVHALRPFDRISVDFVGPKPSCTQNKYLLVMVDEYSRFPFAFPCRDMSAETVISCFQKLFSVFGCSASVHSDRGAQFMSREVSSFLSDLGVIMTHTTPYHPTGNSQCERTNGTVWKAVRLVLRSRGLPETMWETVLDIVLHSVRSLLCTATNQTPHERLFSFPRKSLNGYSLPSWLSSPGPVLLRRFVRQSKSDPLVESVDLIDATPSCARVRFPDGRETTVSTSDLAPAGQDRAARSPLFVPCELAESTADTELEKSVVHDPSRVECADNVHRVDDVTDAHVADRYVPRDVIPEEPQSVDQAGPRRSSRVRKPVVRLNL